MPASAPQPATCSICGARDATDVTDWDGRLVAACDDCLAEVTVIGPGSGRGGARNGELLMTTERVMLIVQSHPGRSSRDIAPLLGAESDRDRNRIQSHLSRLVRAGRLRRERCRTTRDHHETVYFAAESATTETAR